MRKGTFINALLAATLVFSTLGKANAQNGDFFGAVVGGIIGGALANEANKPRRSSGPSISSADRARNVEVQTALNHFGFPVGNPDGILGQRSRSAISQYQVLISFPATGILTEMERQILITAYQRALMGGPQVAKIVDKSPIGLQGLLVAQRDEMLGGTAVARNQDDYGGLPTEIAEAVDEVARNSGIEGSQLVQRAGFMTLADMNGDGRNDYLMDTSVTGSGFWCSGDACAVRVFVSTPDGYRRNDFQIANPTPAAFMCSGSACRVNEAAIMATQPTPVQPPAPQPQVETVAVSTQPEPAPAPAMPNFANGLTTPTLGYVAFCKAASDKTLANGGALQTIAQIADPVQALSEQFCQVSAAAQADGAATMAQIQGFTVDQIAEQCKGFASALADQVKTLENGNRDNSLSAVQSWLGSAGMPVDQLVSTSRICLSVGYARDNAEMAVGSALVLAGTGNMIYAELIGHHLAAGVGIKANKETALEWFDGAMQATKAKQSPLFLADQPNRMDLVTQAAALVAGKPVGIPLLPVVPAASSSSP